MKEDNQKELYRLAVEYLRESKEYKYICTVEEKIGEKDFWEKLIRLMDEEVLLDQKQDHIVSPDELYKILCNINPEYKRMTTSLAITTFARKMAKLYDFFGNIHASDYDFEKWWREHAIDFLREEQDESIMFLNETLANIYFEKLFKFDDSLKPDDRGLQISDAKKKLTEWFREKKDKIVLIVNPMYPIGQLSEEFMRRMKDHKAKYNITRREEKDTIIEGHPFVISNGRIVDEVPLYLKVYRLKSQGLKWKEVIQIVDDKYIHADGKLDESGRRLFRTYYDNAERIIRNVENGIFPGNYGRSSKK